MADPVTLAIIVGGSLTAASQVQEGRIAESQGKLSKQIAIRNQKSLERQAKAEKDAANINEERARRQEKITKARALAAQGKSGGQIAGASLNALTDIAGQFSIERNLILRGGLIRGRELKERGGIIATQGRFASTIGKKAKALSFIKAGGTVLTTIGLAGLSPGGVPPANQAGSPSGFFASRGSVLT